MEFVIVGLLPVRAWHGRVSMHRSVSEQNASDSPRAARPVDMAGIDVLLLVDLKGG